MPLVPDIRRPGAARRTRRLGCVDCGAFFTPEAGIVAHTLRCPRCGGQFVQAGPRALPQPAASVSDRVVLARVELNTTAQPEVAPEDAGMVVEERVCIAEAMRGPRAPRRLVRLRRRGERVPAASVVALPANLGKHAPPVLLRGMTSARLPQADRRPVWALVMALGALVLAAIVTGAAWPTSSPLDRTLRTMQTRIARTFIVVQTPISNTLTIEPIDVETDAATGVALAHGVLHNGTPEALKGVRIEAVLMAGGRPIRRRVVQCCDDLDLLSIAEIGPTHPHLSRGGARKVTLARDAQETFSVLFRGIEPHHFKGELSARLTIQPAKVAKAP